MVTFSECDPLPTEQDVDALESKLGFSLPSGIRKLLLTANGGRPSPSIFRARHGSTDVSECLALREGKGSIWWTYELFALAKKAIPTNFLPFAVDSGGNCFVVDCRSDDAPVHILLHDPVFHMEPLTGSLKEFGRERTSGATMNLHANETELLGKWVFDGHEMHADETSKRIEFLTTHVLQKLGVSKVYGAWETLFRDLLDGRLWERTYPQGEMQGGGPPKLTTISEIDARAKYDFG